MHFQKLRSLFTKTQASLSDGEPALEPISSNVTTASNGVKVPDHKGQSGLILLNPEHDRPKDDGSKEVYSLDVVAIHGITGDAFKTWTHENGTNWLRDFLPNAFPGARVFSFGYPAEVFWSRSDGDIDSFSRSLLEGLKRERRQLKYRSRRTIFICHSMGGIVVKKALTIARIDDDDYGDIQASVAAILFLSTPHRGAGFASLLKLPLQIVSSASLPIISITGKTRKDLIKGLEKEAEPLQEISRNFRNSMKNIKIASFIEQSHVLPLKEVIVDKSSGTMGIPGERIIPMLGCNHTTVCRFEGESSFGYQSIFGVLQDWAKETRQYTTDILSDDTPCLRSLAFLEMHTRRSEADNAHPKTCEWLFLHDSYKGWLSDRHGLLWIKGDPGSGKSTLLAFIYRTLHDSNLDRMELRLQFFFHGRGEKLQKTSIGMFRSLVHQMFTKDNSIREPLRQLFREKTLSGDAGTGWNWECLELQRLLSDAILSAAKSRKVAIYIDALDEAGPDAPAVIKFFHELNDQISETHSTAKICISCRHYPFTAKILGFDVVVEDHNADDIARYVRDMLHSEIRREHDDLDPETWTDLEERIIKKSASIFQWAHLVIPIVLDRYHDGASRADIFQVLETVPKKLEDVYAYIFGEIIKPEYRKRTLHLMQWIFLAERPLTVTEIRYAVGCTDLPESPLPKTLAEIEDFVESDGRMEMIVTSWSGGLAEVMNHEGKRIVQFIHQSVNDFFHISGGLIYLEVLFSGTASTHDLKRASRSSNENIVGRSHDRLARSCIAYFEFEEVQLSMVMDTDANYETLPFLDYATKSWFLHAEIAERFGITQATLVDHFASSPEILSKWIQAYNMIEEFSKYCPQEGANLLHVASAANLKTIVSALLQQNTDTEKEDDWGNRPLHYAARRGHKELTEMLLNAGSLVNVRNHLEVSPFTLAAQFGSIGLVQLLLDKGADVNDDALEAAVRFRNLSLVRFLLQAGADVNGRPGADGMPIHFAANTGHKEILEMLLSHGADINARADTYCSALQAAASGSRDSHLMVQLLLEKGADVHSQGGEDGTALQAGARMADEATVGLLLDAGADVNAGGGTWGSALQAAAQSGKIDTVKLLVDRGANVNHQGGPQWTALQAAANRNHNSVIRFLLKKGADVNIYGGNCGSAIQAAALRGHFYTVLLLVRNKADVNAQGGPWGNPLRAAFCKGHIHISWLLLNNGAQDHMANEEFNISLKAVAAKGLQELRNFMVGKCPTESDASKKLSKDINMIELADVPLDETSLGRAAEYLYGTWLWVGSW